MSLKLLRVQTPTGVKRYNCTGTDTLLSIKQKVHTDTKIPVGEIQLSVRDTNGTDSAPLLDSDHKTLVDCGLKHGDLLMVIASAAVMHKDEPKDDKKHTTTIDKHGNLVKVEVAPSVVASDIIEDPIDQLIGKEDGWIYKKAGLASSTKKVDDYIAPWDIEKHEPWASMELGHIPFHSWSRQHQSGINEECNFKQANTGEKDWNSLTKTVKIQRQPYRHIDTVTFEHSTIANAFVQAYVNSGQQQFGFLYGFYQKNADIPLGISCYVSAIYTPSCWNPMAQEEVDAADKLAARYGLFKVGWTWTALGAAQSEGRSPGNYLKVNELYHIAKHQKDHPNKCAKSGSGQFGSKFLSVLALDNEAGDPHFRSFQLSNQAAGLLNEGVIKVSKKKPNKFLLSQDNQKWHIPELVYFHTRGEEGARITTEKRVERYLDDDIRPFFMVTQTVTFPLKPTPKFTNFDFPTLSYADARNGARWNHVNDKLKAASGMNPETYWETLNDFHFLLWIDSKVTAHNNQDFTKQWSEGVLPNFIANPGQESANVLIKFVREFMKVANPQDVKPPAPSTPQPSISVPSPKPSPVKPNVDQTKLAQLLSMGMGFGEQQATEALIVAGGDVDAAINYLLDSM